MSADVPVEGLPCPRCRVDLVMSDRAGIEIDYCPRCRGVWLDRGELDKILERAAQYAPAPAAAPQPAGGWAQPAPPQPQPRYDQPPQGWGGHGQGYGQGYGHGGKHGQHRGKSWLTEIFD
mgnify:CR=1 FL=1